MKKTIYGVVSGAMALTLAACQGAAADAPTETTGGDTTASAEPTEVDPETINPDDLAAAEAEAEGAADGTQPNSNPIGVN